MQVEFDSPSTTFKITVRLGVRQGAIHARASSGQSLRTPAIYGVLWVNERLTQVTTGPRMIIALQYACSLRWLTGIVLPPDPHACCYHQVTHLQTLVLYDELSELGTMALESTASFFAAQSKVQSTFFLRPLLLVDRMPLRRICRWNLAAAFAVGQLRSSPV